MLEGVKKRLGLRLLRKKVEAAKGSYHGGRGANIADAVVIEATNSLDGALTEYKFIGTVEGKLGSNWMPGGQSLFSENGRSYDQLRIRCKNGEEKVYYFDITSFFGK